MTYDLLIRAFKLGDILDEALITDVRRGAYGTYAYVPSVGLRIMSD